jgi:hypothetical protein
MSDDPQWISSPSHPRRPLCFQSSRHCAPVYYDTPSPFLTGSFIFSFSFVFWLGCHCLHVSVMQMSGG